MGPWRLIGQLGRGGNGTVWRAVRDDCREEVALKVINARRVEREPYQRFAREITFMLQHGTLEGVLPLIDAHLPDAPTKTDRPWLAMPIARPVRDALREEPLSRVVEAVAGFAATLAQLEAQQGVGHRDVKPGNLYELDGQWLIGDFGLIALPDTDGLTASGRPLGPAHYTAYEMIVDPAAADPHPADVYSLGKTLWVLATGQAFPPEGHQPEGTHGFTIGDYRPHHRSVDLDREVDLMTRIHPKERPTKSQVARDLVAWQELAASQPVFDVAEARARLHAKVAVTMNEQDLQEERRDLATAAVRRLQELTAPLNAGLRSLYPRTKVDISTDELTQKSLQTHAYLGDRQQRVFRWQRCTVVDPIGDGFSVALKMGRCVELFDDGVLRLHLMVDVARQGVMGPSHSWEREPSSAMVGTVEAQLMLEEGIAELTTELERGIQVLIDRMPD